MTERTVIPEIDKAHIILEFVESELESADHLQYDIAHMTNETVKAQLFTALSCLLKGTLAVVHDVRDLIQPWAE
jgi:hypothetical protein